MSFTAKTKADTPIVISMNFKEIETLYEYAKQAKSKYIFWISSTETGIGCALRVTSPDTPEGDITDYDSW